MPTWNEDAELFGLMKRELFTAVVGDADFVRGMIDDLDYSKGFAYDFEPGQMFRVAQTWFERFS